MKNGLFTTLGVFALSLSAVFSQSASAAGAIWWGPQGIGNTTFVFFFAHGYSSDSTASDEAREACEARFDADDCVDNPGGLLADNEAYALYSTFDIANYITGEARALQFGGCSYRSGAELSRCGRR